jgi:bifunctional ADP-heptose synthase (sugar kinase/adenylyltransferase)
MRENLKYLVVGDTIIDETVELKACGLSLESPTIKTVPDNHYYDYGGAANVAKFLARFGRNVTFATSVDYDTVETLERFYGITVKNYYQGRENKKTRYWVKHGDAMYKHLQINAVNQEFSQSFLENFDLDPYDIIAFADYRCGFIRETFIKHATDSGKITYASSQISSRKSNYDRYFDIDYLVCNEEEAKHTQRVTNICVTKGSKGCQFNGVSYPAYVPEKVVNTIGAGDCFYAALLATGDPDYANKKASEFVATEHV